MFGESLILIDYVPYPEVCISCIKSNDQKKALNIDVRRVQHQVARSEVQS